MNWTYSKNSKGPKYYTNRRNGSYDKKIIDEQGNSLSIEIPRDREIQEHIKGLYNTKKFPRSHINRIIEESMKWQNRALDSTYPLYLDCIQVSGSMPIKNLPIAKAHGRISFCSIWALASNQFEILCGKHKHNLIEGETTTYTN